MLLSETSEMMVSSDYKERFKAEYFQLQIRLDGLRNMLTNYKMEHLILNPHAVMIYYTLNINQ